MSNYLEKFVLKSKKTVISGGLGLIGKQVATAFGQAGAKVLVGDINHDQGKHFSHEMKKVHFDIDYIHLDITDLPKLEENIANIAKHLGGIDVWVNAAYPRTLDWGALPENITLDSWRKNIDMHLNSYALSSKYVAEHMKKGGGSIINLGSIYGVVGPDFHLYEGTNIKPSSMIYSVIKGATVNLSRHMASYYGKYNIRVNTVCPGGVEDGQEEKFLKQYSHRTALGRMAKAEEVASAVLFLASDAASYVTGQTLMVDGGWTAI